MGKKIKYTYSRLQDDKACWWCNREANDYFNLEHHEFLNGPDRNNAIEDCLWVWACPMHHRMYQNDADEMNGGRRLSQTIYEEQIGDRDSFRKRYRQSYL